MRATYCAQRLLEPPARSGIVLGHQSSPERSENFGQPSNITPGDIGRIDGRNCAAERIMEFHDRKLDRSKLARENLGGPSFSTSSKTASGFITGGPLSPSSRAASSAQENDMGHGL